MQPTHLVILIHGLYGTPLNLSAVRDELESLSASAKGGRSSTSSSSSSNTGDRSEDGLRTEILVVKSNSGVHTWDGIDLCAHRIAEEVDREVERLQDADQDVVGVSMMGYSLGGLMARYLIGILHTRQPSFFARHKPLSFSTAATPHLGQLKYGTRVNSIVHTVGPQMFSRSGRQLFLTDREPEWSGRCLLEVMADPDHIFLQALRQFPRHMIVANGCHDVTVPYPSAAISLTDPFSDFAAVHVEADEDHIIQSYHKIPHYDQDVDPESLPTNDTDVLDEDGEEVTVTIRVVKPRIRSTAAVPYRGKVRPGVPPVFLLKYPWPFSHIMFVVIPFLIPVFLVYIIGLFTIQTYRSRRRIRDHRQTGDRQPLLAPAISAMQDTASSLSTATATAADVASSPSTWTSSDHLNQSLLPREIDPILTSSELDGTSTPPLSDPSPGELSTLLLLTPAQKEMVKNLHEAMPKVKRVVSWFPWAWNSHAMLICRDVTRFPWQEDGRGIVRAWAGFVLESAAEYDRT